MVAKTWSAARPAIVIDVVEMRPSLARKVTVTTSPIAASVVEALLDATVIVEILGGVLSNTTLTPVRLDCDFDVVASPAVPPHPIPNGIAPAVQALLDVVE